MSYPQDFYDAVVDVFVLERDALREKKDSQGYLSIDDILDEPMMRHVVRKYGKERSRHLLVEIARLPRKNSRKFLEFEPHSYLTYAAYATPSNTSPLKVRPWAHAARTQRREMQQRWENSKAAFEEQLAAEAPASRLRATAAEFVPGLRQQEPRRPVTLKNIRNIWKRSSGGRRRRTTRRRRRITRRMH